MKMKNASANRKKMYRMAEIKLRIQNRIKQFQKINLLKQITMKIYILKMSLIALLTFTLSVSVKAFTATVSGNWSSSSTWGGVGPGATVTSTDVTIPAGITVTLDMNVSFTGATNSFTVNGTLMNSTMNGLTVNQGSFTGSGSVSINKLEFTSLGTYSFTGTINLHRFSNLGANLLLGSITNVMDTLNLDGGNILLNTGSNLTMQSNSVIRVNSGSLVINGGI
ncbi:MAG TPA: hypothetical protein VNX68_05280, partial [Nitrosopumilaceae archaeon]|nr:hypothetical protein [Nitrosopumilaceae archaeon]